MTETTVITKMLKIKKAEMKRKKDKSRLKKQKRKVNQRRRKMMKMKTAKWSISASTVEMAQCSLQPLKFQL